MRKQTSSQNQPRGNSTCRCVGHDWQTIASNYRLCQRQGCHASERLAGGVWVSNIAAYRTHRPLVASGHRNSSTHAQQHRMWDARESSIPRRKES